MITLLSHADTDIAALGRARPPVGLPAVQALSLGAIADAGAMQRLLAGPLRETRILVLRVLGKASDIPGLDDVLAFVARRQCALLAISGTGDPDPELAALSSVPDDMLLDVAAYLQAGGSVNLMQMLRYLSDRLLLSHLGHAAPVELPAHGLYHPALDAGAGLDAWRAIVDPARPTAGIVFYRAHWLSGNTRFIDALIDALDAAGLNALPVFTASLRTPGADGQPAALEPFFAPGCRIDVLINTTSFAVGDLQGTARSVFASLDVPVLQAIASHMTEAQWRAAERGLDPLDTAMNVALPEFDGRLISVPFSFKAPREADATGGYAPSPERARRVAGQAARLAALRRKAPADKRIAFIFTNSAGKAAQIGNAVGLDAPASLWALLAAMRAAGYHIEGLPRDSNALIHALIDGGAYDQDWLSADQIARSSARVPGARYASWFAELPETLAARMQARWGTPPGDAFVDRGDLVFSGLTFGHVFVALQPPRGYGMDPDAIYHTPDLPPTHHYYALYRWLRDDWGADAIVHVGKHGTLEWLPGKGVGVSRDCFPDALLPDLPLFYPFILNDPGEGAQAKRRAHATIIDHLTPPMTTADTYGPLAQLTQLVDEYYQVEMLDPDKLPILQQQIWALIKEARLDTDLEAMLAHGHAGHDHEHDHDHDHDHHHEHEHDHEHEHEHEHGHEHGHEQPNATPDAQGVPRALTRMEGVDVAHLIEDIDGYLCELGAAQIRDGLHILGQAPTGEALIDMLAALTRLANLDIPSLPGSLARTLGLDPERLAAEPARRLDPALRAAAGWAPRPLHTHADAIEALTVLARHLLSALAAHGFSAAGMDRALAQVLPEYTPTHDLRRVLEHVCNRLVPDLAATRQEIDHLLHGLAGGFVPPGPSGAPTRGMAHVLPTGRNFYSVDPRSLPSQAAWHVGAALARELLDRHRRETGTWPESVSISIWGTSAMRTHGDDIAEILALLGVRPCWQPESRRVSGIEVIPLETLGRPRIDVTVRISGFFRDAFPHLIHLIDEAVHTVARLDEPPEQNFLRAHWLADLAGQVFHGSDQALLRVFGSRPGTYGAGILPLIQAQNWQDEQDFATTYINWGGYGYSRTHEGCDARDTLRHRLAGSAVAVHNQDNREHDIFDSDDYLQYHGGMIATIRSLSGRDPLQIFGDSHNPDRPAVRSLREEVLRVFRSRVINPKWLAGIRRHGYKGGLELSATVDYLFGYDATAQVVDDWVYQQLSERYALDAQMQTFLAENNPWALHAITDRLMEAAARGLWQTPDPDTLQALRALHLQSEAWLEARGEHKA